MVCDRCADAFGFLALAAITENIWVQQALIAGFILDFGSHYLQFLSSALAKSESHKGKNEEEIAIVRFYYTNKTFFAFVCICAEFFPGMYFVWIKKTGVAPWVDDWMFMFPAGITLAVAVLK